MAALSDAAAVQEQHRRSITSWLSGHAFLLMTR